MQKTWTQLHWLGLYNYRVMAALRGGTTGSRDLRKEHNILLKNVYECAAQTLTTVVYRLL